MSTATVRLFQRAVYVWVLGYILSALPLVEQLWEYPVSPPLPVPGFGSWFMNAFGSWLPGALSVPGAALLIMFSAYGTLREAPRWMAFVIWMLFASLTQRAWLASCGGSLLMNNVLLWMVFLRARPDGPLDRASSLLGFWAIRIQLIFTYLVTGLHKLTGTTWLDGTAVGIVASDPQFGPAWLTTWPQGIIALITWSTLALQFAIPIVVWWRTPRYLAMGCAVLFHLATALYIDIPQMGLAFIACWVIWTDGELAARCEARWQRMWPSSPNSVAKAGA